ncbi:hypothetical protein ACA910_013002 [Epithemia clementina (nom. ined.)]
MGRQIQVPYHRLRSWLVCTMLVLVAASILDPVCGQRAIVNLGKRIFSRGGSSSSKDQAYVIEDNGEERPMHLDHVDLSFEGIRLELNTKKEQRLLLDGSPRGRARPGRMLAIMGPSGSGKTTLIHALVGRIKQSSKLFLQGYRYVNGQSVVGDSIIPSAFIPQEAVFFPHMTVRETLTFRVELKLGSQVHKSVRDQVVNDLLEQVDLTKSADTIVGDSKIRGISGGERKRLSIAVEMIDSPSLVFLDEPTSGLDSTACTSLIQTLRNLADQGKTVVAVIHQPSQHVFSKFDDLLLVSEGKQMYFGEVKHVRSYVEKMGYPAEPEIGTAEHVLDCISRQPLEDETLEQAAARMENFAQAAAEQPIYLDISTDNDDKKKSASVMLALTKNGRPKSGLLTQFRLLFGRSFREVTRGKTAIFVKLFQQITVAIIYGGIYSIGTNQASIQDRFGLMSLIAIGASNMAVAGAIRAFPKEKAIVSGELASSMYHTLPYFVGKALSELPLVGLFNTIFGVILYKLTGLSKMPGKFERFLGLLSTHGLASEATGLLIGAISPNSDVALAIFPAILVLNIIFDGKNISEENTPYLLRWIPKFSLIRWGFEGLCLNEFEGLEFDTSGPRRGPVAKTGADALARFGLGNKTLGDVVKAQGAITLFCWFFSYLGLSLTRERFMIMQTPKKQRS